MQFLLISFTSVLPNSVLDTPSLSNIFEFSTTFWSEIKCFSDASFSIFKGDNIAVFSDGGHGWGAKVSTTSLFQRMKCVGRNYSKSVLPLLMIGPVLRGRVDVISSLSHWLMEEE